MPTNPPTGPPIHAPTPAYESNPTDVDAIYIFLGSFVILEAVNPDNISAASPIRKGDLEALITTLDTTLVTPLENSLFATILVP